MEKGLYLLSSLYNSSSISSSDSVDDPSVLDFILYSGSASIAFLRPSGGGGKDLRTVVPEKIYSVKGQYW